MKCPICNAWTFIKDTRSKDTRVHRRRECANGHKFSTDERIATKELKESKDADKNMAHGAS